MGVEFIDTIRNMIMPEEVSEAPAEWAGWATESSINKPYIIT
jgi:hypothetical protein